MDLIQFIFARFSELTTFLGDTTIYDRNGLTFTMLGLTITIFVVHLIIDIAMFFFEPKSRIRRFQSDKRYEQKRLLRRHKLP